MVGIDSLCTSTTFNATFVVRYFMLGEIDTHVFESGTATSVNFENAVLAAATFNSPSASSAPGQ